MLETPGGGCPAIHVADAKAAGGTPDRVPVWLGSISTTQTVVP